MLPKHEHASPLDPKVILKDGERTMSQLCVLLKEQTNMITTNRETLRLCVRAEALYMCALHQTDKDDHMHWKPLDVSPPTLSEEKQVVP